MTTDVRKVAKDYKSFQPTLSGISGPVRIVLLREEDRSWRALMCSDRAVRVDWIIQASTDRWAIEQSFHDLKETEGIEKGASAIISFECGCIEPEPLGSHADGTVGMAQETDRTGATAGEPMG
jgi:hypothetical protein